MFIGHRSTATADVSNLRRSQTPRQEVCKTLFRDTRFRDVVVLLLFFFSSLPSHCPTRPVRFGSPLCSALSVLAVQHQAVVLPKHPHSLHLIHTELALRLLWERTKKKKGLAASHPPRLYSIFLVDRSKQSQVTALTSSVLQSFSTVAFTLATTNTVLVASCVSSLTLLQLLPPRSYPSPLNRPLPTTATKV